MRYYMTLYVKVLQSCRPSKLGPAGYRTRAWRLVYKIGEKRSLEPKISAFFWPPTLKACSSATPWDKKTYNTSFERSDVWLLSGYTFRGVAVLFRPAILPQSTPTLLHISAIVRNQNFIAVYYTGSMTPGVPGAPEPRMYPRSRYFLVYTYIENK